MPDLRKAAFVALSGVLIFGSAYSVIYNTYLDTSNPLLTSLPHPLSSTHYFANKANPLNTIFIKRAWGWTSGAFLLLYVTAPPNQPGAHEDAGLERMYKWLAETGCWIVFTSWFFGPAVLERVIAYSGGECVLALPNGGVLPVPEQYCFAKSPLSPATHPALFASPLLGPGLDSWKAVPRLRKGHDISGHVFLLTMCTLFLADQLRASFRRGSAPWPAAHKVAVGANFALMGIWLFSIYTTSIYFHTVFEKFTGYSCFAITQTAVFDEPRRADVPAGEHVKEE
ncbi:hypothetical protein HWV62_29702 [Athelia sp. TMB]|nr:hypothetical protein HWV62_29702 [Athelia sp. TMB]